MGPEFEHLYLEYRGKGMDRGLRKVSDMHICKLYVFIAYIGMASIHQFRPGRLSSNCA